MRISSKAIWSLTFLIILGSTLQLNAQSCKYDYDEEDEITGERERKNTYRFTYELNVSLNRASDTFKFQVNRVLQGEVDHIINSQDQLILKLGNGESIPLSPEGTYTPSSRIAGAGILTDYKNLIYNSSREHYEK